jgi:energy-coupling factor transporter ATP-binding protein EcfA2
VPDGAIYGLVGPNGAGKTTTMDAIFGMGGKDGGSITVLGLDHLRDEVAMNWRGRLRPLRTLPLGTWRLNALILGTPVGHWLAVWCTAAVLHVCFPAAVTGLRADVIAGLIGVSALFDAFELPLRIEAQVAIRVSVMLVATMSLTFGGRLHALSQSPPRTVWLASCVAGAAGLALAAWLNRRTLTRSSAIYRPSTYDPIAP